MKADQPVFLPRATFVGLAARRIGAAVAMATVLGLGACGGGSDDEAGKPLVPVAPGSTSSAGAASAPGG